MLETLKQDYVRTARAKGASPTRVVIKHALRGGLLPVVTFLGPAFAGLVSGSFIIESIFFIPGLGKFFVTAAFNRDYTMVLGTVLFYATLIILLNLLVDFLQAWLDPKARSRVESRKRIIPDKGRMAAFTLQPYGGFSLCTLIFILTFSFIGPELCSFEYDEQNLENRSYLQEKNIGLEPIT